MSTPVLEEYLSHRGMPAWRDRAIRVVRELERFNEPDAINGIEKLDVGTNSLGIGINYQRSTWLLWSMLIPGALSVWLFVQLGLPVLIRRTSTYEIFQGVAIPGLLAILTVLSLLLYCKRPGPDIVVVVDQSAAYIVSRAGIKFTPREVVLERSESRLDVRFETRATNHVTVHLLSLWQAPLRHGRPRRVFSTRVDAAVFRYWEEFVTSIDFMNPR